MTEAKKTPEIPQYCGYVAIVGRTNVGKSTLLNALLATKLSITSHKPQTTRRSVLGVSTKQNRQIIYVDTPGLHQSTKRQLNRYMNRAAMRSLSSVDLVCFVVDSLRWTQEDEMMLTELKKVEVPVFLVVNKVDNVKPRTKLLPHLQVLAEKMDFHHVVPVSAKTGNNVGALEKSILESLPERSFDFSEDQLTNCSDTFIVSEFIREKLMRALHQELPYGLAVDVQQFQKKGTTYHIDAVIWVERKGQKIIVIGEKGQQLKHIGQQARLDMERWLNEKVFLTLWVKVKENWSDDKQALQDLGYE